MHYAYGKKLVYWSDLFLFSLGSPLGSNAKEEPLPFFPTRITEVIFIYVVTVGWYTNAAELITSHHITSHTHHKKQDRKKNKHCVLTLRHGHTTWRFLFSVSPNAPNAKNTQGNKMKLVNEDSRRYQNKV